MAAYEKKEMEGRRGLWMTSLHERDGPNSCAVFSTTLAPPSGQFWEL